MKVKLGQASALMQVHFSLTQEVRGHQFGEWRLESNLTQHRTFGEVIISYLNDFCV